MNDAIFFDMLRQGLWTAVMISAPLLTVALVVGLVIGLFQALTSVQEMTLTFVPKVGAMMAVFWVSMTFHDRDPGDILYRQDHSADRGELTMDNAGYVALTRQSGLMREMQIVANNIANACRPPVFAAKGWSSAEHVRRLTGTPRCRWHRPRGGMSTCRKAVWKRPVAL